MLLKKISVFLEISYFSKEECEIYMESEVLFQTTQVFFFLFRKVFGLKRRNSFYEIYMVKEMKYVYDIL